MSEDIPKEFQALMRKLAGGLNLYLNGSDGKREVGFVLLTWNDGENIIGTGNVNFIGNVDKEGIAIALAEIMKGHEGGQEFVSDLHKALYARNQTLVNTLKKIRDEPGVELALGTHGRKYQEIAIAAIGPKQ